MKHSTVAILGGGPIGLEAALACASQGWSTTLYERGQIGENMQQWGHVKLFSPFVMNRSATGLRRLTEAGVDLPAADQLLTGAEFVNRYLLPLSQLPELTQCLNEQTTVHKVARSTQLKGDNIGSTERAASGFRLLIENNGVQRIATADFVLDCTGTFGNHNWAGNGGIPCAGEVQFAEQIDYGLPDISGADKGEYLGKNILVIGSGYSAATNVAALSSLSESSEPSYIFWVARSHDEHPIPLIPDDRLVEREQLTKRANQLATAANSPVQWIKGMVIDAIEKSSTRAGGLEVKMRSIVDGSARRVIVDRIIANVGYRPDRSIYEELQIHECYATHGPMKLAAALMGETSADCLAQTSHGSETLINPEPNYYILGSKSYGRSSRFLINIGLQQVENVTQLIAANLLRRATLP